MTTIDTRPEADAGLDSVGSFFACAAVWVTSTDHKRIGRLYVGVGLLVLTATAVLGALLGFERSTESGALVDSDALLQMFQMYRVGLVFGAIIPLGLGLAIAVAPLQLGARQIAFPRLALTGFFSWLGGLALTMTALARNGGIGGGEADMVDLFLAGHGLMALGLLASAGCVATSVLTTRAPGMTMRRVPLFAWSALVGSLGVLLALPVAFGAVVYLFIDNRYAELNFGGPEGIGAWLSWAFSAPAVIVYALPAVGVAAEMMPVTFKHRQVLRGVMFAGITLVGVAALAAVTLQPVHGVSLDKQQGTVDFVKDLVPMLIFAGLPILGLVVVVGLGAFTAKSGLKNGKPKITSGFVFSFFGVGMIAVGVIGNLLQSIDNLELVGTVFEEGAVLYIVYGTLLGVIGGLCFWAPKLWGRVLPEKQVLPLALLGVGGTVLASLPLYLAGFLDQVGGLPVNDIQVSTLLTIGDVSNGQLWNVLAAIGHLMVALTVVAFVGLLIKTYVSGSQAEQNPFGGHTVEWSTSSPAPADNFADTPTVASAQPQFDMTYEGSLS